MANPLKVLTALSASSGVAVSGSDGLKVQQGGLTVSSGTSTFAGTTISDLGTVTTADINGGTIDNVSIGATTQAAGKFTTISGSSNLEVGGTATIAGQLTVQGGMTVNGTLTTVNTTNLEVTDKKIIIASGSTTESQIDEAGIYFGGTDQNGGGAVASITYNSASSGVQSIKLSDDLELPAEGSIYNDQGRILRSTSGVNLGAPVTGTLISSPYGGAATVIVGNVNGNNMVMLNNNNAQITVTSTEISFDNGTVSKTLTELASGAGSLAKTDYYALRQSVTASHGGSDVSFSFSGSNNGGNSGDNHFYSAVTGLTSSTAAGLIDLASYASFDVAVQSAGATNWTNDLVSVTVTASNDSTAVGGSVTANYWFPKFIISAPSLTSGAKVRLIVVNEKDNAV